MIRCFLPLVLLALFSATVSAQCPDGRCPVPSAVGVQAVQPTAITPAYASYPTAPVVERVVSLYPAILRPVGVSRVDVVFGQPMASSQTQRRTLFRPFGGRFRR